MIGENQESQELLVSEPILDIDNTPSARIWKELAHM